MTIRYQCHSCGSKLNIKEELAGTAGKCPKCKTEFTVPEVPRTVVDEAQPAARAAKPTAASPGQSPNRPPGKAKMAAKAAGTGASRDENFDPVAFLMEEDIAPSKRRSSAPLSDDEIPAALELDISDDDDAPRHKSRSRRRVKLDSDAELAFGSASATAGAMLSSGASAGAARDLLTRTVEESRARASRLDDQEERGPSVVTEVAREIAVRGLPLLLLVLVVAYGLYYVSNSLMGGGVDLPDLGRVTGTITLDGQPLAGAEITFQPNEREFQISERKTVDTRASTGTTDKNGYYKLSYMEDVAGAVVGEHRVSISKRQPNGPAEMVPSQYGPYSVEMRTVERGSNDISFDLKSDAPR